MTMLHERPLVLCVDDDPQTLSSLHRLLRYEPYDFETTLDPMEAIERAERGEVDVLILDQVMPRMMGTDLIRMLRARSPDTVLIVLTAHPDREVIAQRAEHRIDRLVTKPWDDDELKHTIAQVLSARVIERRD